MFDSLSLQSAFIVLDPAYSRINSIPLA